MPLWMLPFLLSVFRREGQGYAGCMAAEKGVIDEPWKFVVRNTCKKWDRTNWNSRWKDSGC